MWRVVLTERLVAVGEKGTEIVAEDHDCKVLPEAQRVDKISGTFDLHLDWANLIEIKSVAADRRRCFRWCKVYFLIGWTVNFGLGCRITH